MIAINQNCLITNFFVLIFSGKCGQHKEKDNCPTSSNSPETKPETSVNAKDNSNEEPMVR